MSSILTNNSAMTALQTLKSINKNLSETQNSISTGKDIASAKDNSAIWAISKVMESDVSGFKAISDSLALGESTVAVASAGAEQITNLLTEIKEKVVAATGANVDRTKLNTEVTELKNQIGSIINASQFNGMNLLKGDAAGTTGDLNVLSSIDRNSAGAISSANIVVDNVGFLDSAGTAGKLYAAGALLGDITLTDITSTTAAETQLDNIEAHIKTAIEAAAALGASSKRISDQSEFVSKVTDAMKSGIGSLVDADMEAASARLQALQTQQQLGVQALSIANQSPQMIMQLFR